MNQGLNLNEYVEIAQKKFPSFVIGIVAFNSAEVWSNTNVLMDLYLTYFKPFKGTKLFIILKLLTTKFMEIYLVILLLQMKMKRNRNSLSQSVINYMSKV